MAESALADELAIRSLVSRYAEAVSALDENRWAETWAERGEWRVLGRRATGRAELVAVWRELVGGLEFVLQHATSGYVEPGALRGRDGERATGSWQILELGRAKGGDPLLNVGLYRDEYVREQGVWRFARRVFSPLYMGPPDLSGNAMPFPGTGCPPA